MSIEIGLLLLPNALVSPTAATHSATSTSSAHTCFSLLPLCFDSLSCCCQGFLSSRVTRPNLPWSNRLNKPPLNPPNLVFPIVWPTLYLLMGVASYRIYTSQAPLGHKAAHTGAVQWALAVYGVQLFFNFMWSIVYFHFHSLLGAVLDCYLLTTLIVITMRHFLAIDAVAGWLLLPYLVWSCYAAYLATGIYVLNPSARGGKALQSSP